MNEPLRHTPSPERRFLCYSPEGDRFWCYSPEGDGLTFWRTAEERDAYAKKEIRTYLDDNEWFEEVEGVIAGEVTHITQAVNIKRPSGEIDEDGYDEEENGPWESPDQVMCDYALVPLPEAAPAPADGPSDDDLWELYDQMQGEPGDWSWVRDFARAVLARWGRPTTPPAPAAGEVEELVSWLGVVSEQFRLAGLDDEATQTDRAATLLERQAAQAPRLVAFTAQQLECLRDNLWQLQDEGPPGEGWASAELQELRDLVDSWLPLPTTITPDGQEGADG